MADKILLFRLNLPKEHLQENIEVSLNNTVRVLKSSKDKDGYYVVVENDDGYKVEELSGNVTASFLVREVADSSKDVELHIWSPRDPDPNVEEYSAMHYFSDKKRIFPVIDKCWNEWTDVYCVICDTDNVPHYLGKLIAYSPSAKEFLERIFLSPDLGELTSAFFFSKEDFFSLESIRSLGVDLGNIGNIITRIEDLCKTELQYPLKYVEFDENEFTDLLQFLRSLALIKQQVNRLDEKKEAVKNFLKGRVLESVAQLVFEELLNYRIQPTGYENWASILREDVIYRRSHGRLASQVRKLPDFYFSYRFNFIPPLRYKENYIRTGWLEVKYRKNISSQDIEKWKSSYEPETFLLIYQAVDKQFYFLRVSDLPISGSSLSEEYLLKRSLLPFYDKEVLPVMNEMIDFCGEQTGEREDVEETDDLNDFF
jgi:transposase